MRSTLITWENESFPTMSSNMVIFACFENLQKMLDFGKKVRRYPYFFRQNQAFLKVFETHKSDHAKHTYNMGK